ncbi:MAG: peptidylprolyl isomerase [Myxococcota bacterium]
MNRWIALAVLLMGCGPDPELVAARDALAQDVEQKDEQIKRLERENDSLHAKVRNLNSRLNYAERQVTLAQLGVAEGEELPIRIETTKGRIDCTLWPTVAPKTVLNFVQLAEGTKEWTDPLTKKTVQRPLYDGTKFHRVIPKFMIQGGDPLGTGTGGPGYQFEDETSPDVTFDEPGLLAMANAGPNTNGSQFFITDRATPVHLNGKHTIFGKCEDLDVVERIAEADRDERDRPAEDVIMRRIIIDRPG